MKRFTESDLVTAYCESKGYPLPTREHAFCPGRRWRFDWAWPEWRVAIEQDGAVYTQGRHTRGKGFERDAEKINAAVGMGWSVYRFSTGMVKRGDLYALLDRLFGENLHG